jgi:hypothetical protein
MATDFKIQLALGFVATWVEADEQDFLKSRVERRGFFYLFSTLN